MNDQVTAAVNGTAVNEIVIDLRKEIEAHGEKTKVLKMREPTPDDVERIGMPVVIGRNGITFDTPRMAEMISTLAKIPPSSVRLLDVRDWTKAAYELLPFFAPGGTN